MKINIHKIQAVFNQSLSLADFPSLEIVSLQQRGSLYTITARGNINEIQSLIKEKDPVYMEVLPLTLEEIFISETEVKGYDIKKLLA